MTDLLRQWTLWELHDNFPVVQGAPHVQDPETGATVDPTSFSLEYGWSGKGWFLMAADVHGPTITEDGEYSEGEIECRYYDPVNGPSTEDGKAPDWVLDIANKRMSQLPTPPTLPEGWNLP